MDLRGVFSLWGFPRYGTEAEQYAADHLEDRPDLTDAANDEWQKYWTNAFAHTYASAMIAYHYDADTARTLGNTRENIQTMWGYLGGDPPRVGAYMDLGNNEVGIQIGQIARERGWPESAIPWLVEQAANAGMPTFADGTEVFGGTDPGRLFVHPNDPRIPRETGDEDGDGIFREPLVEDDPIPFLTTQPIAGAPYWGGGGADDRFNGYPADMFWLEGRPMWTPPAYIPFEFYPQRPFYTAPGAGTGPVEPFVMPATYLPQPRQPVVGGGMLRRQQNPAGLRVAAPVNPFAASVAASPFADGLVATGPIPRAATPLRIAPAADPNAAFRVQIGTPGGGPAYVGLPAGTAEVVPAAPSYFRRFGSGVLG